MNIVRQCALVGASLIVAYACANPVSIDEDVFVASPGDFGDAGLLPSVGGTTGVGTGGSGSGVGGTSAATGGTSSSTGGTGAGVGGNGNGVGGTGASVGGTGSGTGGTGAATGGTASGTGGTGVGTGGTAQGGTGAGTGGTGAGTGGTGSQAAFDPESCNFTDPTGCEDLACDQVCPDPNSDGNSCLGRCTPVITCVTDNAACVTEADPLCGGRNQGQPKECTTVVEPAGGFNSTNSNQPSFVARQFVDCMCRR
jgi:hypothetical protein